MTTRPIFAESCRRPVSAAAALVLLLAVVMAAGCVSSPDPGKKTQIIPGDKYVFLEHSVNRNGVNESGECRASMNSYPLYSFDHDSKILKIEIETANESLNETVNESLVLYYGMRESLSGAEGGGARSSASPVYALPISVYDEEGDVTLHSIAADGTVNFDYHGLLVSLKPNESRENITHRIILRNLPEYSTNCTVEIITTDRFYNAGLVDKKTIRFHVIKRVPVSALIITEEMLKTWNTSPGVHYELIMGMDQFPGFLTQWNEKMAWGLSPEQVSDYSEEVKHGRALTNYISSNQKAIEVVDIREFCKDIAKDLGLTPEQSDQFAQAAKDYYDRERMAVHGDYYTIGH